MPIRRLLVGIRYPKDRLFVKRSASELHAEGSPS